MKNRMLMLGAGFGCLLGVAGYRVALSTPAPDDAAPTTAPSTAPATQPTAGAPINKLCPIQGEEINPKVTYVYKGQTIGFCCKDCIPEFKKDPEKYMKDLK